MRVLIAEDEERVADAIARGLRREGLAVDVAHDGENALYKARVHEYDVVVLDRDLPRLHGDDVCRALNSEQPETKVLMLTAARELDDVVEGLALGADDYLPKPFRFAELLARLNALARRNGGARPTVLRRGDVALAPPRPTGPRGARPPRRGAPPAAASARSTSAPRSSACWRSCSPPTAPSSRPRSSCAGSGTSTRTRSRTPSAWSS